MLRKQISLLLLSICFVMTAYKAIGGPASLEQEQATVTGSSLDPARLSLNHIMEEIIPDSHVGDFTLYGLDGLASLTQGMDEIYNGVSRTLHPYVLFNDLLDGDALPNCIQELPNFPREAARGAVL
jgi:hypothetical protein